MKTKEFQKPHWGDRKCTKKFILFPKTLRIYNDATHCRTRWLEFAWVVQIADIIGEWTDIYWYEGGGYP